VKLRQKFHQVNIKSLKKQEHIFFGLYYNARVMKWSWREFLLFYTHLLYYTSYTQTLLFSLFSSKDNSSQS